MNGILLQHPVPEQIDERACFDAIDLAMKPSTFEVEAGAVVEAVLIPEERRNTLCISTQVGCGMGFLCSMAIASAQQ